MKDETVNHMVNECSKLAQKKYKGRLDWVRKVNNWELCKRLKFDHTTKWYMHKPESVLENRIHKILLDFEIQMDHSILARRLNRVLIKNKRTCHLVEFLVPADHGMKIEGKKKR